MPKAVEKNIDDQVQHLTGDDLNERKGAAHALSGLAKSIDPEQASEMLKILTGKLNPEESSDVLSKLAPKLDANTTNLVINTVLDQLEGRHLSKHKFFS